MTDIAFIGAGRMASAIINGLIASSPETKERIICFSASGSSAAALSEKIGIRQATDLPELLLQANVVVVAFKPQHLSTADSRLAQLTAGKLVISVLAAKTLDHLSAVFPQARNIVRTMPNTPSAIGAGITGWSAQRELSAEDRTTILSMLASIGQELEVPESKIDALMGVSGCGPAFVFEFTGALRDAGMTAGLTSEEAQKLAIQTVLGSAQLMARSSSSPEELRDQVTSPNGTTFAGLQRLSAHNLRGIMQEVVQASKSRSEELARA